MPRSFKAMYNRYFAVEGRKIVFFPETKLSKCDVVKKKWQGIEE